MEEQSITGQYSHWIKASVKLTRSKYYFGGISNPLNFGRVEINVRCAQFIEQEIRDLLPDPGSLFEGEGIFYNFSVFPTHEVKPFNICFKCTKRNLDPGTGYFFSRTDNFTLCQGCGIIEPKSRDDPKKCPPYKHYLYFKFQGDGAVETFDKQLMILSQEDYMAHVRDKTHKIECNGCGAPNFTMGRFRCAVCRDINVCEKCMGKMVKGNLTETDNPEAKILDQGCSGVKEHTFLYIVFNNTL